MVLRVLMVAAIALVFAKTSIAAEIDPSVKTQFKSLRDELLVENAGGMPALCRAANGDLLFAHAEIWEPVPSGGSIRLRRSTDDGRTWSKPSVIVQSKSPEWTATTWSGLHTMPDGSLIFAYNQTWTPKSRIALPEEADPAKIWDIMSPERKCEAYIIRSADYGRTWSAPQQIEPGKKIWLFGRPLTLGDGAVIIPAVPFHENDTSFSAFVRSCDNGCTWGHLETIADGPQGFNEVTLGLTKDGGIVAIFRDIATGPRRQFRQALSHDGGKTWTKPRLINIWGKMPDLLTLPDGRLVLAVGSVDCMDGHLVFAAPDNASYAGLFISSDDGRTWHRDLALGTPDSRNMISFDAPVLTSLENGNLLAISFAADRRHQHDPLFGWTRGMHYVWHELAPTSQSPK